MPKRSDNLSDKGGLRRFKFKTSSEWLPPKVKGASSVKAPDYETSVKSSDKTSKKTSNKSSKKSSNKSSDKESVADMLADMLGVSPEDITEDFFDRLDEENGSEAHYHTEEYYQDINTLTNLATTSLNDLGVDINNVHRKAESVMADYYRDMVKSGKTYNVAYKDQNDNDAYKTMMDKSGMEMARLLGEVLREL